MDTSPSHFGRFRHTRPATWGDLEELAFASIRLGLLLERVGDGDKRAFSQLYELTGSAIFDYLAAVVPEPSETEETFARVYSTLWVTAPRFRAEGTSPSRWIMTIARDEVDADSRPASTPRAF